MTFSLMQSTVVSHYQSLNAIFVIALTAEIDTNTHNVVIQSYIVQSIINTIFTLVLSYGEAVAIW